MSWWRPIRQELPRTLHTLTAAYQDVLRDCFELIVVENGSIDPVGEGAGRAVDSAIQYRWSSPDNPVPG